MTSHFNLTHFYPYLLSLTGVKVSDAFKEVYEGLFTNAQWRIMCHLHHDTVLSAKQLCDKAMLDKSTASRAIVELQKQAYVMVVPSKHDKRAKDVQLTQQGEQAFTSLLSRAIAWQEKLLSPLSDIEQQQLGELLAKINASAERL